VRTPFGSCGALLYEHNRRWEGATPAMSPPDRTQGHGQTRRRSLAELATRIGAPPRPERLRVAVDGVDCAGKSTMADELATLLRTAGFPVIRASVDGFHNPRSHRHRRPNEALSYYEDSFDYEALRRHLLEPLGPAGDLRYRAAVFDHLTDRRRPGPVERAAPDAVLLFDGVFLMRPELRGRWDLCIFVHAAFEETVARAVRRDAEFFGGAQATAHRYLTRYVPGQLLYLRRCRPHLRADLVVENTAPAEAEIADPGRRWVLLRQALAVDLDAMAAQWLR
jgi:uridine kinase